MSHNEKPTVSSLERADNCPASCAIPIRVNWHSAAADRGNEIHAFVEAVLAGHKTRDAALLDVPIEWRQTCADLDWNTIAGDFAQSTIRAEVAYGIDAATGGVEFLGKSLGRKYPKRGPTTIIGTLDIEGSLIGGRWCVADVKTGQRVTTCAENWQIRFHAYALHKMHDAPEVVGRLLYVDDKGGVAVDEHVFTVFDFDSFPGELRSILDRIAAAGHEVDRGILSVTKGDWCKYCPSFQSCPAQTALVRRLVPDLAEMDEAIAFLTTEQAGVAWARFKELAPMVKRIDAALKEYVRAHPNEVILPDGRVVAEIPKGRDNVNGERAIALAREYGATDDELQSCVRRAEWTELRAVKVATESKPTKSRKPKKENSHV